MKGLLQRIATWRWFRIAAPLLVGTALFALGVVYLNLDKMVDMPGFVVVGGNHGLAGRPLAVRVSAHGVDSRASMSVSVDKVLVAGQPVEFTTSGSDPTIVSFLVPEAVASERAVVTLGLSAEGRSESLEHSLTVLHPSGDVVLEDETPPAKRVAEPGQIRVDVMPENSVLALGMVNSVVLRLRDDEGRGLSGVPVRIKHKTCLVPPGVSKQTTDVMGLLEFKINAKQPGIRLKLDVFPPDKPWVEREEPLRPRGRRMLLRTKTPVFRPGDRLDATLRTWQASAEAHCDLLREGAVLWSGTVTSSKHEAQLRISVRCDGRCDLQCAGHPWDPGDEFATVPIIVTSDDTLSALTSLVRAENVLHPNSLELRPGVNVDLTARYLTTFLQREPVSPSLWISTRERDIGDRTTRVTSDKRQVLIAIGGVFVLIMLVVADVLIRNLSAQRARMRAFAEEALGEELPPPVASVLAADGAQKSLERTRGVLLLIAMVGALVANLVGIVWLLALVGQG